jgi:hypothetical protein
LIEFHSFLPFDFAFAGPKSTPLIEPVNPGAFCFSNFLSCLTAFFIFDFSAAVSYAALSTAAQAGTSLKAALI